MSDSEDLDRIFRAGDDWSNPDVVRTNFEWLSGCYHKLDEETRELLVQKFIDNVSGRKTK